MSVQRTIEDDYKRAFKSNDRATVSALRMLKSAIKNREIEIGRELTDEETVEIVSREAKGRNDAITQYQKANRSELVAHEQGDLAAYRKYLPTQLTDAELAEIVKETVASLGASGVAMVGKVMGAVMPKVKGRADGTAVQAAVRKTLGI